MKQLTLTDDQFSFLKRLVQNTELRGFDVPKFLEVIEAIKSAKTVNQPEIKQPDQSSTSGS
jgi:ActR/RegA family two-component response regulator